MPRKSRSVIPPQTTIDKVSQLSKTPPYAESVVFLWCNFLRACRLFTDHGTFFVPIQSQIQPKLGRHGQGNCRHCTLFRLVRTDYCPHLPLHRQYFTCRVIRHLSANLTQPHLSTDLYELQENNLSCSRNLGIRSSFNHCKCIHNQRRFSYGQLDGYHIVCICHNCKLRQFASR